MSDTTNPSTALPLRSPGRGIAIARVWTTQRDPLLPADISDLLYGRGFMPGFSDPEGRTPALAEVGLADARFGLEDDGYRVISLTSSKGGGCRVWVRSASREDLPDDYIARRTVPNPRLVYFLEAGGPGNSDRNLCENIAEALMIETGGLVEIRGLGTKGNKPVLHHTSWLGGIKTGG
jgi:hypothetical protein